MPMVDVTAKPPVLRVARARARVRLARATLARIRTGRIPKGNVLELSRAAAVLAMKGTPHLLPLCHPVAMTGAEVEFRLGREWVEVTTEARAADRTGVEMEALTGAAAAALCIWDMCKGVDDRISIDGIRLLSKTKAPL